MSIILLIILILCSVVTYRWLTKQDDPEIVLDAKPFITLIRVGPKPGFYLAGKFVGTYADSSIDEITSAYVVYDFWNSPEAEVYTEWWWAAYGHPFEDALRDIPSIELRNEFLALLGYNDASTSSSG